jgi:hypothetical protein
MEVKIEPTNSLEHLVAQDWVIIKKKQFIEYYQEFNKRYHNLHEEVSKGDRNQLFWKGLPSNLQQDIFDELRACNPAIDWHKAPAVEDVHQIALRVLDKNSIFANLTVSRNKSRNKKSKDDFPKKKKRHSKHDVNF